MLFGRGSGCINTGGEKVFPEEVEAAIRSHVDVFDAVVVGMPDPTFGQKVVALVSLHNGAPDLTLAALQEHCRTLIAGYKIPRALLVGDAPRTNAGKPDYTDRAAHRRRAARGEARGGPRTGLMPAGHTLRACDGRSAWR